MFANYSDSGPPKLVGQNNCSRHGPHFDYTANVIYYWKGPLVLAFLLRWCSRRNGTFIEDNALVETRIRHIYYKIDKHAQFSSYSAD